ARLGAYLFQARQAGMIDLFEHGAFTGKPVAPSRVARGLRPQRLDYDVSRISAAWSTDKQIRGRSASHERQTARRRQVLQVTVAIDFSGTFFGHANHSIDKEG